MTIRYFFQESFSGFKRAKLATSAAIFSICIALLLLSLYAIVFINLNSIIESLRNRVEMEAFLDNSLTQSEVTSIKKSIESIEGVKQAKYISKEQAAEIFKDEFGEDIHRVLEFNPLPASYKIYFKDGYQSTEKGQKIFAEVKMLPGVEDVIFRKTLVQMLDERARLFLIISLFIGGVITLSSIILVANTIRLAIFSKRKIIQTMKLIGATNMFIRLPFIIEGIIQGIVGGAIAAGFVYLSFENMSRWIDVQFSELFHIEPLYYAIIVGTGCLFGLLGSSISIRKFLKRELTG